MTGPADMHSRAGVQSPADAQDPADTQNPADVQDPADVRSRNEARRLRQLCGTVLAMEAIIIGLAIPVAISLEHVHRGLAGGVGGALACCALLLSGVVGRRGMGWTLVAGTVLQALVIASGVVVTPMYALGVIFAALWITGIWLARRLAVPAVPGPHAS
jgi:hypothetical protein